MIALRDWQPDALALALGCVTSHLRGRRATRSGGRSAIAAPSDSTVTVTGAVIVRSGAGASVVTRPLK